MYVHDVLSYTYKEVKCMENIVAFKNNKAEKKSIERKKMIDNVKQYDIKELMTDYDEKEKKENVDCTILKHSQEKNLESFLEAENTLVDETLSVLDKWKKEGFNPFS